MDPKPQCAAEGIEALIRRHADMVYRLAFSLVRSKSDADDIFQEVFLRLVRSRPAFESEAHQKAWLIRVTTNCAKKHWASPWMRRIQPLREEIPFYLPEEQDLSHALDGLSTNYRLVIHLFYFEEYSIEEISKLLQRKPSTVRAQLTRARAKLRHTLKEDFYV